MFDFKDRVLLVMGSDGGIGGATASYFRSCDARVMMADINEAAVSALARGPGPQRPAGARAALRRKPVG